MSPRRDKPRTAENYQSPHVKVIPPDEDMPPVKHKFVSKIPQLKK
jgi:hypothetical protein